MLNIKVGVAKPVPCDSGSASTHLNFNNEDFSSIADKFFIKLRQCEYCTAKASSSNPAPPPRK
jgi:hypothetical protein